MQGVCIYSPGMFDLYICFLWIRKYSMETVEEHLGIWSMVSSVCWWQPALLSFLSGTRETGAPEPVPGSFLGLDVDKLTKTYLGRSQGLFICMLWQVWQDFLITHQKGTSGAPGKMISFSSSLWKCSLLRPADLDFKHRWCYCFKMSALLLKPLH